MVGLVDHEVVLQGFPDLGEDMTCVSVNMSVLCVDTGNVYTHTSYEDRRRHTRFIPECGVLNVLCIVSKCLNLPRLYMAQLSY